MAIANKSKITVNLHIKRVVTDYFDVRTGEEIKNPQEIIDYEEIKNGITIIEAIEKLLTYLKQESK